MNVNDLVTDADLEEAPENADDAFAYLVAIADRRLSDALDRTPTDDNGNDNWQYAVRNQYAFMNFVTGLAEEYAIEAFMNYELPKSSSYRGDGFDDFKADLDRWIVRRRVSQRVRSRRDFIIAFPQFKETIRTHIHYIRQCIDKAELTDAARGKLLERIAEFEKALDKDRFNLLAVGRVTLELISLGANVMTVSDSATLHKLLSNLNVAVGIEKGEQSKAQMLAPAIAPPQIAVVPRKAKAAAPEPPSRGYGRGPIKETFPADLDDEIPF